MGRRRRPQQGAILEAESSPHWKTEPAGAFTLAFQTKKLEKMNVFFINYPVLGLCNSNTGLDNHYNALCKKRGET
jgi:hypothetical protein